MKIEMKGKVEKPHFDPSRTVPKKERINLNKYRMINQFNVSKVLTEKDRIKYHEDYINLLRVIDKEELCLYTGIERKRWTEILSGKAAYIEPEEREMIREFAEYFILIPSRN